MSGYYRAPLTLTRDQLFNTIPTPTPRPGPSLRWPVALTAVVSLILLALVGVGLWRAALAPTVGTPLVGVLPALGVPPALSAATVTVATPAPSALPVTIPTPWPPLQIYCDQVPHTFTTRTRYNTWAMSRPGWAGCVYAYGQGVDWFRAWEQANP